MCCIPSGDISAGYRSWCGWFRGSAQVHNHPSGGVRPSPADIRWTERLVKGARILRVRLLDHVIVGRGIGKEPGYFSFQEAGLLLSKVNARDLENLDVV